MVSRTRFQTKTSDLFSYYPVISYANTIMQNLTVKLQIPDAIKNNKTIYFTYSIADSETRPEHVARKFYGDAKLDWVVLVVNQIIDPIFSWPMDQYTLEQFIKDKYGSVEEAQSTNLYYQQVRLVTNESLTTDQYELLTDDQQKYWLPQFNYTGNIVSYNYDYKEYRLSSGGYDLLSAEEKQYYEQITQYDYEVQVNNNNKLIRLLKANYLPQFVAQYKKLKQ